MKETLRQYLKKNGRLTPLIFPLGSIFFFGILFWNSWLMITGEKTVAETVSVQTHISEGKTMYSPTYRYKCGMTTYTHTPRGSSSNQVKTGEIKDAWCTSNSIFVLPSLAVGGGVSTFLMVFIIIGCYLLYKNIVQYKNLQKLLVYGTKVKAIVTSIEDTGNVSMGKKGYKIICTYNGQVFSSEVIFNVQIHGLQKGDSIEILVDNPDAPKKISCYARIVIDIIS